MLTHTYITLTDYESRITMANRNKKIIMKDQFQNLQRGNNYFSLEISYNSNVSYYIIFRSIFPILSLIFSIIAHPIFPTSARPYI